MDLDFLRNPPPAEPPQMWEISEGRYLAWNEYGDPNGKPVMYYHGWPSSRWQARLTHHLALERGLRLIAMDRPGVGRSTFEAKRSLQSWPVLMERFATFLGIDRFGQLGVSGGGPYVLACAGACPDRLTGSVVLAGAVPLSGMDGGIRGLHPFYRMMIPLMNMPGPAFDLAFRAASLVSHCTPAKPPLSWLLRTLATEDRRLLHDCPEVWAVVTRSFQEGMAEHPGRGALQDARIYFQDLAMDLRTVRHPIRYWHGGDDRNIRLEIVREFTGKIAGAHLEIDEALGHFSLVIHRAPAALDYLGACD